MQAALPPVRDSRWTRPPKDHPTADAAQAVMEGAVNFGLFGALVGAAAALLALRQRRRHYR